MKNLDSKKNLFYATLLVAIFSFILGFVISGTVRGERSFIIKNVENIEPVFETTVDFDPFWKAWVLLSERHISSNDAGTVVSPQDKLWGAISGLARSYGDPYTVFLPPEDKEMFDEDISGLFQGVGMEIGKRDNFLTVIAPLKNTPAYRAGILSGDIIVRIDGQSTHDVGVDQAVRLIRGPAGTEVVLEIIREGESEPLEISVVRDVIEIPTIDTELLAEGVFLIRVYNFSGTVTSLFREALREFALSGVDNLVIDVRGNPGGFLDAAVDISSWFLPAGKVVVIEDYGDRMDQKNYRSRGYNLPNYYGDLNLAILVDGGSASASEIFAGALSEHGVASLVGTKTFGKGSIQELVGITPETSLKITVAKWLTPKGVVISDNGLLPDFEVEMTAEERLSGEDPQLEKAVEILLKR